MVMKSALFASLVLAVATGVSASAESRKVRLRAICFEHAGDLKKVVLIGADGKTAGPEIRLFTSAFSDEVEASIQGDDLRFALDDTGSVSSAISTRRGPATRTSG